MAVDVYPKTCILASKIVDASVVLMNALRAFDALTEEHQSSGIDFSGVDFSGANQALQKQMNLVQCSGDDINLCLTSAAAIKNFTDANFHSTNLDRVRP